MTIFFFVRHGLTPHTGQRLSGWTPGVHLTPEGRAQAEAVAEDLAEVPLEAVFSSPIERTVETARPIARRLGVDLHVRRGLGEVDYGRWTDRSLKVLARTKLWSTVRRFPSGVRFPDGETLREVQARAVDEVEAIRSDYPKQAVCCVSHADVIKLVAAHYLGIHIDLFQRLVVDPGSTSVIAVDDYGPRVLTLNRPPPKRAPS